MDKFNLGIKHQLFNNEIRKRRLDMGLTQKQLAKKIGLASQSISQIETMRYFPGETKAKKIARFFKCEIEDLFPRWIEIFEKRQTTIVTEHLVTERMISHPELKSLPAECDLEGDVDKILLKERLEDEMKKILSDRERKVLMLKFGLFDDMGQPMTYEETGKVFGVTRERIRQIEAKALRKMKTSHKLSGQPLRAFL